MRQGTGRKQLKLWLLRICLPAPASLASQGSLLEMQSLGPQACEPTWALASSMPCGLGLNGPHCGLPSGPPVQPVRLTVVSPGPGCHLPAPGAPAPHTEHPTLALSPVLAEPPDRETARRAPAAAPWVLPQPVRRGHCSPQGFLAPLGVKFQAFRLLGPLVAELLLGNTFWYFPLRAPRCESGVFYRWVQIHSLPRAPSPHPSRSGLSPPGRTPASTLPWTGQENHEAQVYREDLEEEEASGHLLSLALGSACRWSGPTGSLPSCGGNSWNPHKFCEPPFPEV